MIVPFSLIFKYELLPNQSFESFDTDRLFHSPVSRRYSADGSCVFCNLVLLQPQINKQVAIKKRIVLIDLVVLY